MKTTVSRYDFQQAFTDANRAANFTSAGLDALFNYLEEYEEDTGEEIELDVIALCCEYTEYADVQEFAAAYSDSYLVWETEPEEPQPCYIAGWNMPGYMPDSEPQEFDDADEAREYIIEELQQLSDDLEDADDPLIAQLQECINGLNNSTDTEQAFNVGGYHYFITADTTETIESEIDYEATLDKIMRHTQVIDIDGESFIIQDF